MDFGIKENQYFDFKRQMPHSRDEQKKYEFRKDLCAFANSYGGFLIIGVAEDDRKIVGIDRSLEVIPQINQYQKTITPSISYDFKTLSFETEKIVYVLHIRASRIGPHSIKKNDGLVFPRRLPGSNADMTYEEVRSGFMLTSEKLSKLKLLLTQLAFTIMQAEKAIEESDSDTIVYPLALDMTIFNLAIGDAYSLISTNSEIIGNLSTITAMCGQLNLKVQSYFTSSVHHGPALTHNLFIRDNCNRLKHRAQETISLISSLDFVRENAEQFKFAN